MTGFLASVATLEEMDAARDGGADIVDLKDPSRGALGAWDVAALEQAVARWRGWSGSKPLLSATIGDCPMHPDSVRVAAEHVAATGVPLVKLGVFAGGDPLACFAALRPLAGKTRLIAVLFADQAPDVALLDSVANSGFYGAMLDTADKASGGLRGHLDDRALTRFVARTRAIGLVAGLAGSLRLQDVAPLAELGADYLGFRGALCVGGRTGGIDADAVARVADALRTARRAA